MQKTDSLISSLQQQLVSTSGRFVLGFSGGRDSVLLLKLLQLAGFSDRVLAVHVAHGLQDAAREWPAFCESLCRDWGVAFHLENVVVSSSSNVEALARDARRSALLRQMGEGDVLLLAHHMSDQAETFWLRALRGAGAAGLAGMRGRSEFEGRTILRPLLGISRDEITALCETLALSWVDDPSNEVLDADRNFVRHRLMPLLASRWSSAERILARNTALLAEQADLLSELAEEDLRQSGAVGTCMPLAGLSLLSPARRYNLLHYWVVNAGFQPAPRALLEKLDKEFIAAPADRLPQLQWPGAVLVRFDQSLWLLSPQTLSRELSDEACWQVSQPLMWNGWRLEWQGELPAEDVWVGRMRPGEKILFRGHHRPLTELWRDRRVPPWERQQLPVVRASRGVLAVALIGQCDNVSELAGMEGEAQILLSPL